VYIFPGNWQGLKTSHGEMKAAPAEPSVFSAPYGEAMPEGVADFREALQRDGLILIKWEKYDLKEGVFFNVLWAKSNGNRRLTQWSGAVREEELPYTSPADYDRFDYCLHDKNPVYIVNVAPEAVLAGPPQEYLDYIQFLKDYGLKIDFDYNFNWALEKRKNYLQKYSELIALQLPPRALKIFTDAGITRAKEIAAIPLNKLRNIPTLGAQTIQDTIDALKKHNIILQEEEEGYAL
jgi:hypothetical protein